MTIYVQRAGDTFEISGGQRRLRAALHVFGKAIVTDCETDEKLEVREVGGQLVVSEDDSSTTVKAAAAGYALRT